MTPPRASAFLCLVLGGVAARAAPAVPEAPGAATSAAPAPATPAAPDPWARVLMYDHGRDDARRHYRDAAGCDNTPCVITDNGALRFALEPGRYHVRLWVLSDGRLTRIDHLEKHAVHDYDLSGRVLNRRYNRRMWSLGERIEEGRLDVVYVYGLHLQYRVGEGDPLIVEVSRRDRPDDHRTYYFRYHRPQLHLHLDLALLFPVNAANFPRTTPPIHNRPVNAALTLAFEKNRDPEKDYSLLGAAFMATQPTLVVGLLSRELDPGGRAPAGQTDAFVGAGVTFLDFLFVGWGANLFQAPRTSGPFVGIHLRRAVEFLGDLDRQDPKKWDDYLEREKARTVTVEPPPPGG